MLPTSVCGWGQEALPNTTPSGVGMRYGPKVLQLRADPSPSIRACFQASSRMLAGILYLVARASCSLKALNTHGGEAAPWTQRRALKHQRPTTDPK